MRKPFIVAAIAALLLAALLGGCVAPAAVGGSERILLDIADEETTPKLTVSATGTVKLMPDIAYVTVGVVTQHRKMSTAQETNREAMNTLMAALKAAGLKDEDLRTTGYSAYPHYDYSGSGSGRIAHYEVRNTLQMTLRDIDSVGDFIDIAAANGANTDYSLHFTLEEPEAAYNEALAKAVKAAAGKADVMAAAGGQSIVQALTVSEGYDVYGVTRSLQPMAEAEVALYDEGAGTPITAGELEMTASVTVVYQITE